MLGDIARYASERGTRLLFSAATGILVARHLGPASFGVLSFAIAVFGLLAPSGLLGMRAILVREFSTKDNWRIVLVSALARQLPAAMVVAALSFVIVTAVRGFDGETLLIATALLPLPVFMLGDTFRALLESKRHVRRIVTWSLIGTGVASALKLAAVLASSPIWVFALAATIEAGLAAAGWIAGVPDRATVSHPKRFFQRPMARKLIRESLPLLVSGIAVMLYMRADIVMLGLLSSDEATGGYVAAAQLSEVWYFLPMSALAALRPKLAQLYAEGALERYRSMTQRFMTTALVVSIAVAALILAIGDRLIFWLYGSPFGAAVSVLRVHILAAPFVFLGLAAGQWFIDRRMTRVVMLRSTIGASVNIIMNLVLIPGYGALGAAIATLISYSLSGVVLNALARDTRPVFWLQLRAFRFSWG